MEPHVEWGVLPLPSRATFLNLCLAIYNIVVFFELVFSSKEKVIHPQTIPEIWRNYGLDPQTIMESAT